MSIEKRIVYQKEDGGVAIVAPTPEYLEAHTIEQLAKLVVPVGASFKIINVSEVPADRTFRDAWEFAA